MIIVSNHIVMYCYAMNKLQDGLCHTNRASLNLPAKGRVNIRQLRLLTFTLILAMCCARDQQKRRIG